MPSSDNKVIIACAGSGKTTYLVESALANRDRRIAIVTYTNNNYREIVSRFGELNSGVPDHVDVFTWFGFLLQECARPYQCSKYSNQRIDSLLFINGRSAQGIAESNVRGHYFANDELLYSDKIAKFAVECEKRSTNGVTGRLGEFYTDIFIDEFQDLASWDLDVVEMFLQSSIRVTLVGDPRQHIYSTNSGAKHTQYLGAGILKLVQQWVEAGWCTQVSMSGSHRCHQSICDFSNLLWPDFEPMTSLRQDVADHEGVFLVSTDDIQEYILRYRPQVLRYDKNADSHGQAALNFGASKGRQFQRVLVVPNGPIKAFLKSGKLADLKGSKEKLHVAVTRARSSVAFIYDRTSPIVTTSYASSLATVD